MSTWCQNNATSSQSIVFVYTLTHRSIINLVELCYYIMEYGSTITTPGHICHQFVFFFSSPSKYPWCRGGQWRQHTKVSPHQIDVKYSLGEFEKPFTQKVKASEISPAIKVTGVYTAGDVSLLKVIVKSNSMGCIIPFITEDTSGHKMEGSSVEMK